MTLKPTKHNCYVDIMCHYYVPFSAKNDHSGVHCVFCATEVYMLGVSIIRISATYNATLGSLSLSDTFRKSPGYSMCSVHVNKGYLNLCRLQCHKSINVG